MSEEALSANAYTYAYCLFCYTGYEERAAQEIRKQCPGVYALPIFQEKHRSQNGKRTIVKEVMLPGYLFLFTDKPLFNTRSIRNSKTLKLLKDGEGIAALYGENLSYARWVLRYDGLIGTSKAARIGSRIKVIEGPLKDLEGCIKEVSKKNRNGRVEMTFMNRKISVWLPFEWVQETDSPGIALRSIPGAERKEEGAV